MSENSSLTVDHFERRHPVPNNDMESCKSRDTCGPFYKHGLTFIPTWISDHMPNKMWDEITYPLLNFNRCTDEV